MQHASELSFKTKERERAWQLGQDARIVCGNVLVTLLRAPRRVIHTRVDRRVREAMKSRLVGYPRLRKKNVLPKLKQHETEAHVIVTFEVK